VTSKSNKVKETHVWQHTVPESYLKRFSDNAGLLNVYDKVTGKIRQDKPANVAAGKHFYTFPRNGFVGEVSDEERKAVEHIFAQEIEPRYSDAVEETIQFADRADIPERLHEPLVLYLIMQHLRTATYREHVRQLLQKRGEEWAYSKLEQQFPGSDKVLYPTIKPTADRVTVTHNRLLFDRHFLAMHMDVLMNYIWSVGVLESGEHFYTSDTPVARTIVDPTGNKFGDNLWGTGLEYALPLDSKHVLLLLERTYFGTRFPNTLLYEGQAVHAAPFVTRLNQAQTANCYRCVFAAVPDMHIAEALCRDQPHLRKVDRHRIIPFTNSQNGT